MIRSQTPRRPGRPKSESPKAERLHLYLEPGTVEQIRGVAALRRRAVSATARELLEERLAELSKVPA